jgi:GH15 family glucan-1,4-alpha-glucosidase
MAEVQDLLGATLEYWQRWIRRSRYRGRYREMVERSALTLKLLVYQPTGALVAAPTTSLPEAIGGVRNWDYRFCWVRDATLVLQSLMHAGYMDEARAWRDWLLRAVAGSPSEMQIMYGPAGERRLTELELDWLPGYAGSAPVRIGNAASNQFQLDVYGELMDALQQGREGGIEADEAAWRLQVALMGYLESAWEEPDEGIWEVRGKRRPFVHSKVMAWVAFDRAVRMVEHHEQEGPVDRWRALRAAVHREVCERGYDRERNTFTQSYGSRGLDAATLMIPVVGFLPPTDERVIGTVEAIQRELLHDGFVLRYDTREADDGQPPGEGAFLPCSFWLADCLTLIGRHEEAREMFDRLAGLANDVGLLAEEYDPRLGRQVGNFPQAFTHVGLVNTAMNLDRAISPARARAGAGAS